MVAGMRGKTPGDMLAQAWTDGRLLEEEGGRGSAEPQFHAICGVLPRANPDVLHLCVMERVGIRELRQNLSVYLRRVQAGQRLEVTERGRPVARLEPIVADERIARLEREGRVVARGEGDLSELRPLRLALHRPLSVLLDEARGDTV